MPTATEALVRDHRMIRKLLDGLRPGDVRFPAVFNTLRRVVLAHAWFEDEFLLPALKARPLVFEPFRLEVEQEHQDIARLMARLSKSTARDRAKTDGDLLTLRALLDSHFIKEEKGLFPLAEMVLTQKALLTMGTEMELRKTEVRPLLQQKSPRAG